MKRKIVIAVAVLVVIILLGVVMNANRTHIGGADIDEVFQYNANYDFLKSDGNLLAVNNDGIVAIGNGGEKKWEAILQSTSGHANADGDYVLFFDKGGYTANIYKNGTKLSEITTNQPILNAKINKKGYASIISYEIGYKSKIEIYSAQGNLVYNWKLGEGYAVDSAISPNGKTVAAIILYTDGGALESCVALADINREIAVAEHKKKDSLLFSCDFQSNGNLVCIGESEAFGYNGRGVEKWHIDYGDKSLQHFAVPYSDNIALVFAGGRNNSIVEFYNERGVKKGEYTSDEEINSLDTNDGAVAVSMSRKVVFLNSKGREKSSISVNKDISDIVLVSKNKIAVVGNNTVDFVK